ncbi:restriction endonuclease subunit S [Citrobacter portucalensis]|uniref:restriction endonuclease subunit S n=1 Tax=Citrobacter portucalensis TaxID=1639133 RepID=UPI001299D0F7|nr:restriction endonuclease subunit S [Citrobacter portucalensis]MRF60958.1 restriction endonuclease subunit S [Citrobacter portucalensis]
MSFKHSQTICLDDIALSINTGLDAIRRAPIVNYKTDTRCLRIQDISQKKPLSSWGYTEVKDIDFAKYQLVPGDIIMARTCSTGINYLVKDKLPAVFNNGLARIRVDLSRVDPVFLYYVFQSKAFSDYIYGISAGTSVQLNMKVGDLSKYQFELPGLNTQKSIASILEEIDEKIHTTQAINQTLEQMAQALFKSWFVDFEPVKAKMAVLAAGGSQEDATLAAMTAISGKDADALAFFERKHPEQYAELKATAELFPSAMQGRELGEIPEGWQLNRLSNLAILHYGKALKKTERIEGSYPVYGSGGVTGSHNNYLVEGPSIIVGRKGSIGTLYWEDGKFHPIDTVYFVEGKDEIPLTYLYYLMKTLNLSGMNTDAAVPGLNRDNVYRLEVLQPDKIILSLFDKHMSAIRNNIQKNDFSTVILSDLRDTLLPKLLSGEITLPEAEKIISEEA